MATKIIHKKSTVASKVPLDTDLEQGELAVNLTDQKIYSKNGSGNVVVVGEVNVGGGNADTLDSLDSSQFLRSDAADTKTSGDLGFSDNVKATFGASSDLQIYHDGSNSYVNDTGTGELVLKGSSISMQNATGTGLISFDQWGAGSWKYEGSNAISVGSSGTTIGWGGLNLGDNTRAYFGNSSDLQIYHDGSNSYIDDTGTGNLQIRGNNLYLQKYTGENYLRALADGAVDLYYNNSSKLATTSTGVSVSGNVAVSGTVDGRDVATDGTKLDGIEAGADVTDATNVTTALGSISIEAHSDVNTMTPSDGQVLTWDNGNSRWDAATPSGGDLVLLETWVPTAVSSKTFTWDESQYLGIRLVVCGISGDGGQASTSVYGYMGYNNGASFAGSQYEYAFYRDDNGSMYTLNEFTYIPLIASDFFDSVGNDNGLHGTIDVMTPASNDAGFSDFGVISNLICSDYTAINCTKTFAMIGPYAGASSPTSTYDSFKIQLASGAFNAGIGEVYVYGYKR